MDSKYSNTIKQNILLLHDEIGKEVFGSSRIIQILGCSGVTATSYIKRMKDDLGLIVPVDGMGKGKYVFDH